MNNPGLPKLKFVAVDQYGGELTCEYDPIPFLKAFSEFYRNAPPHSQAEIQSAINEAVEQLGVAKEQAEAAAAREIERLDRMVADGLMYFFKAHLISAIEEALNAHEKITMCLALDVTVQFQGGTKKTINRLLDEQKSKAQSRLRAGRGRHSNPFRFWQDLLLAMAGVEAAGNPVNQENVASQMGYESARSLQKQLDSHHFEWDEAKRTFFAAHTP